MALELPGAVLFACNFNRVRSPMAERLLKLTHGTRIFVDSCGLRRDEEGAPDPFVLAVMDEIGADVAHHRPKTFDELDDDAFDLVISLTPEAHHRAVELEYWPIHDPTLAMGSRDAVLEAYRDVRDALRMRIAARFGRVGSFGG